MIGKFNSYWGPATWFFLHTFANKVKSEHFETLRSEMIDIFKQICFVLPCPHCQEHAKKYVNSTDFNKIKSKQDFIDMLWTFHNIVNKRNDRLLLQYKSLVMYDKAIFIKICNNFFHKFSKPLHNQRLFMDSMRRTRTINNIKSFISNNIDKFDN
tara:strand:- start:2175 stop:2639 length:465 start_codon:yes stop_codon:yes gene_type:complete